MKLEKPLDPYILKRIHTATEAICEILEINVAMVRGKTRRRKYHHPRCMVAFLMSKEGMSLAEIGRYFCGRDHTTVINMIKVHHQSMEAGDEVSHRYQKTFNIFSELWESKPSMSIVDPMEIARCRARKVSPYVFPAMKLARKERSS